MIRLYNTLSRKIEDFKPLNSPTVTYYSCGPTVYDYAHIGHARTYVFADILQRVLEYSGYKVKRVMNITDVGHLTSDSDSGEDKMEKGAKRKKKTVWEIAQYFTEDFFQMLGKLNIRKPEFVPRATEYITSMIYIIEALVRKGYTYQIADGVYFDTSKFPSYGQLTGQTIDQLQKTLKAGARVDVVPGKIHPTDFALWKFSYPHGRSFDSAKDDAAARRQMEWDSPWGKGFPGWHIECSAMSMDILGETIDIHSGGVDHIPIHHTNEIVQSEAATGKQFVMFWLHGEHLLVNGKKMSKSQGNFYRLNDLERKGFSSYALRYLFLNTRYRQLMNFTWKSLKAAQLALEGLREEVSVITDQAHSGERDQLSEEKLGKVDQFRGAFEQAINDDLNTAKALAVTWEVIKSNIPSVDKRDLLRMFDEVLGLKLEVPEENRQMWVDISTLTDLPSVEVQKLNYQRLELRKAKKYKEADNIRQKIEEKGYIVKDSSQGSQILKLLQKKKDSVQ